ncbi:hypothetical protein SprV_0301263200 [Sparganum proliferum]
MREKATWMRPWLRHWYLLDYVLIRKRERRDMLVTKAIPGADGWTDHRLVTSKMRTRLQSRRRLQARRIANLPVAAATAAAAADDNTWVARKAEEI